MSVSSFKCFLAIMSHLTVMFSLIEKHVDHTCCLCKQSWLEASAPSISAVHQMAV